MFALSQLLPMLLQVLGPLIALVIVLAGARGRAKVLGGSGAALLLVCSLGNALVSVYLPVLMREGNLSASTAGLLFLPFNLLGIAGLVLLAVAVVAGCKAHTADPAPGVAQPNQYDPR